MPVETLGLPFVCDDGGRASAGYKGQPGDCITRAIAIATGMSYQEVYDDLNILAKLERPRARGRRSSARDGVGRETYERYLRTRLGWKWTATMHIGSGCQVHLRIGELPAGRLIVRVSKHMVAVVNGVIHDTYDPGRDGTRCVYGYWAAA